MVYKFFDFIENFSGRKIGILVLSFLPVAILLFPLISGNKLMNDPAAFEDINLWAFNQSAIRSGDSSLWNPYVYSGFPVFISTGGYFSPVYYLLLKFFSLWTVYALMVFLALALGVYFTTLFLLKLGVSRFSALAGGIVWIMWNIWISSGLLIAHAIWFLPALFYFLLEIADKKIWPIGAAIAVTSLILFSTHWHFPIETILAGGVFALYLSRRDMKAHPDDEKNKKVWGLFKRARVFTVFIFIAFVAVTIGLIQLIPTTLYIGLSERAQGISHWQATRDGFTPVDIIGLFFPFFNPPFVPFARFYIGVLPLFFVLYSFSLKMGGYSKFFSWFFVVILAFSINYSPLFWILHHIPPITFLHASGRWMFLGNFCLAVLTGLGIDAFCRDAWQEKEKFIKKWIAVFGWIILFFSAVIFIGSVIDIFFKDVILRIAFEYFDKYWYVKTTRLPLDFYHSYITKHLSEAIAFFSIRFWTVLVSYFFLICGYFFVKKIFDRTINISMLPRAAYLFISMNLILVFFNVPSYVSPSSLIDVPATVSFLKTHLKNERFIVPFGVGTAYIRSGAIPGTLSLEDQTLIESALLQSNKNLLFSVEAVDFFEPLASRRMGRVTGYAGGQGLSGAGALDVSVNKDSLVGRKSPIESKIMEFGQRRNILNFLGVRYLVSSLDFDEKLFKKVFETKVSSLNIPVFIYENQYPRARFYFADSLEVFSTGAGPWDYNLEAEESAFEKLKKIPEEGLGVFIECGEEDCNKLFNGRHCEEQGDEAISLGKKRDCFASLAMTKNSAPVIEVDGRGEISVQTKKNTVSLLKTKSETPQFLVFSENHLPGWKAYVDGGEVPIYTVGSVYMGVSIPEGEHEVKFEFTYRTVIEEFLKNMRF